MATQTLPLSTRVISQPTMTSLRSQLADESIIREQVLLTHNHDGTDFDANFILGIVENILSLMTGTTEEAMVEKLKQLEELNHKELPLFHIRQLSFEIASGLKAASQHWPTIHLLTTLSSYSWETKLVLMLSAFSIIYGEFCLVSRFHEHKGLARKLAQLKQSRPNPTPSSDNKKAVVDCISSILELTKFFVELKQTPSYSMPPSVISALPMASYWIGRSVVNSAACCAHLEVQSELTELTTLTADLLATFSPELEKKKAEESYKALQHALYHNSSNKSDVFRLMFNVKNDDEKIFGRRGINDWNDDRVLLLITSGLDISNERIDFLNWFYNVASAYVIWIPIAQNDDASWTAEDEQQFAKFKDMIEFPLVNDPQKMISPQFTRFVKEELFPHFQIGGEPIIVSLDQRGKMVHPNAMHMILTWDPYDIERNTIGVRRPNNITPFIEKELKEGISGINREEHEIDSKISDLVRDINKMTSDLVNEIDKKINDWTHEVDDLIGKLLEKSTPYESEREKHLWRQETAWRLHLVLPNFGPYIWRHDMINNWIDDEKHIFLYGGNDIKWVRKFTSKVHQVGSETQLKVELAYVGRNEMIRAIIAKEGMSHCAFDNCFRVWLFWMRLRSMFLSRIHYLNATSRLGEECNDEILQELKKLLVNEGKNTTIEGWALLSKGKKVVVWGHGAKMLQVMNDYEIWKENIATKGFDQAFKDHHEMLSSSSSLNSHSCCILEYPITLTEIPENEKCPECSRHMHKFITFTCCHGHDVDSDINL